MKLPLPGPAPLLHTLTDINLDDLLDSAGLARLRHTPLRGLLRPVARRFARVAHEFDERVGAGGLAQGSSWMVQQMTGGVSASGVDHVPADGPVLILANHPGMTDAVALFTCLAFRPDLRVIAQDRPFLRALPHVARQLLFVPDDEVGRTGIVRAAAKHLKQGGALLSFPAGEIEPDPAVFGRRRAIESLQNWSDSFEILARLAPRTRWVAALVSNVVSHGAQRHPLTLLRRSAHDKEKLAAALQVAMPRFRTMMARVAFGPAQPARAADGGSLKSTVANHMRHLIEMQTGDAQAHTAFDGAPGKAQAASIRGAR